MPDLRGLHRSAVFLMNGRARANGRERALAEQLAASNLIRFERLTTTPTFIPVEMYHADLTMHLCPLVVRYSTVEHVPEDLLRARLRSVWRHIAHVSSFLHTASSNQLAAPHATGSEQMLRAVGSRLADAGARCEVGGDAGDEMSAEDEKELTMVEAMLRAHSSELGRLHAFYAAGSSSGGRNLLNRERLSSLSSSASAASSLEQGSSCRLNRHQFSRLFRECGVIQPGQPLSSVDAIFHTVLRAAARADAQSPIQTDVANSASFSGGEAGARACSAGVVANGRELLVAMEDSAVAMGLVSFLSSLILISAASPLLDDPASASTAGSGCAQGKEKAEKAGCGEQKLSRQLAARVNAVAVRHLLPRTCSLQYLLRGCWE
jgi:hypothetical protein